MKSIRLLPVWMTLVAVLGLAHTSQAVTLTLAWAPNTEPDLAGYVVSYGTQAGTYTTTIDAGPVTAQPLPNLVTGLRYYVVVRAYNTSGLFSAASQEISGLGTTDPPPPIGPVPVAAYAFNEGIGTTAVDASGNGRTGVLSNATWTAAGKTGGALAFNGTSSRVTVADAPALHLATALTLEAWIRPAGTGVASWQAVLYKGTDNYFLAMPWDTTAPTAGGLVGGGLAQVTSPSALPANTWTHVATTYDGALVRLFVNGTQVAAQPATGLLAVSTSPLEIGGSLLDGGPFAGLLDDVRVYNTALTPAQIQTDMLTPVASAGPSDTQPPTAPTTLTVTAGAATQLTLTWTAATDAGGVTGYRLERCTGAGCTTFSQVATPSTSPYSETGLVAATSYTYRVRATDAAGNLSSYSAAASATTLPPAPTAPASPTPASASTGVAVSASVSWAASTQATQYDVAFGTTNPPAVVATNQTGTTYQPAALTAGTTYYWQVVAKGAGGATSGPIWSLTTVPPAPTAPASPTPAHGATGVATSAALSWAASTQATQYDVAFGTTNPPAVVATNQTGTTYRPAALTASTTYYWQVVAKGAGGATSGPIWSLTTVPPAPTVPASPTPAHGATGVATSAALSWAASTQATQYDVAFGTTNPPAVVATNQTGTTYQPAALTAGITYYWQVVAKGAGGATSGPIWSLTTVPPAPTVPASPIPAHGATGVATSAALSWAASTQATQYDVAFGPTNPPAVVASNQTGTTYQPAALTAGTTYYWQVVAKGAGGATSGPIWSLTTVPPAPTAPASPLPTSGATGVATSAALSWAASTQATQYDVAFGPTNPPAVVASNQTGTTYQPAALTAGTTYYWQVVAKGAGGATSGPIWSLTTAVAARPTPVAAYAFNEGTGTTTGDATGNGRTGVLTNATWTTAGKTSGALAFNGTSSRVTVADAAGLRLSTAMTLEAWINPSAAGTPDWQAIIYKGFDLYVLATIGATVPTGVGTVSSGPAQATSPSALPANTWSHVATTYDGALVRLFVNGLQVAAQPATGLLGGSTSPLEIGGSLVDAGPFAGLIDDVRVYNTALTAAQIQTDMTTPVASASDTQAPTAPTALAVTAASTTQLLLTWTAATDAVGVTGYRLERCTGAGCTTFSQVATPTAPAASETGLVAATSYTYRVRATDAAGNLSSYSAPASATTLTPPPAPALPAGPTPPSGATGVAGGPALGWTASANTTQYDVAFGTTTPPPLVASNQTGTTYQPAALTAGTTYYWQVVAKGAGGATSGPIWSLTTAVAARPAPVAAYGFNEGTGTTTSDATGNGRTGVLTNATWTATGKNSGALAFNGTSSRVTVADAAGLRLSTAMTLEAWINPSAAGTPDWQAIIYKGFDLYVLATIGATVPTGVGTVSSGPAQATSPSALPANTWSHVATTYDGTLVRLFVNGLQVAAQPATGLLGGSTSPLEIGGSLIDGGPFAGLIDDVRVYNTALTAAQIQADMTTPVAPATPTPAPSVPAGPLPAQAATNVLPTIALNWTATPNAAQYDVAFGTTNPPPTVATNQPTTYYQPATPFGGGVTYFWQVTAKGAGGTTAGPVWRFTAQAAAPASLAALALSAPESPALRLLTWHVNGGRNQAGVLNVDAQVALLVSSGAQVIALQGVTMSTAGDLAALYQAKLANATSRTWNALWIPAPPSAPATAEGNLLLTTFPVAGSATTTFDSAPLTPSLPDAQRSAGWIGVVVNQVTVHIATTQLALDPTRRDAQLGPLTAWLATVPAPRLLGGDFNLRPTDAAYGVLATRFRDAWTALTPPGTPGVTQPAPAPGSRADYWWAELATPQVTPLAIRVLETATSTHHAVVLDVTVQ